MSFRPGIPSGEELRKHMWDFTLEQSNLRSQQSNVRAVEEKHSVEEFFQSRTPGKVPSSSIFATLTTSRCASSSNPASPEGKVEEE